MNEELSKVQKVYAATSVEQQHQAYNSWAADYERDLCAMGYRMPAMIAAVFCQLVPINTQPILDVGCGGGIQAEPLHAVGYQSITGIDLSEEMLKVAESKNIYSELQTAVLGERLDFPSDHFGALLSSGTFTSGHAPPESFNELIRIAKPDALIMFSLRDDPGMTDEFRVVIDRLVEEGKWRHKFQTPQFYSMPYGEPDVMHRIQVYQVC